KPHRRSSDKSHGEAFQTYPTLEKYIADLVLSLETFSNLQKFVSIQESEESSFTEASSKLPWSFSCKNEEDGQIAVWSTKLYRFGPTNFSVSTIWPESYESPLTSYFPSDSSYRTDFQVNRLDL
ncbi:hypothetical protein LINPERHAP1_LOCUS6179, partial [Linum perenne]